MMKKVLVILFLVSGLLCRSQQIAPPISYYWHHFSGKIGNSEVELVLYMSNDGKVKGSYLYTKYQTKIQLAGYIKNGNISLSEYYKGKITGYFNGKFLNDTLTTYKGLWSDSTKTKSIPFNFEQLAESAGLGDHLYPFYSTDDEVENFAKSIKTSIVNGDKKWIADHIHYPFKFYGEKGSVKDYTAKTKQDFINKFDLLYPSAFRSIVNSSSPYFLYSAKGEVMFVGGLIWIYENEGATQENHYLYIKAINY